MEEEWFSGCQLTPVGLIISGGMRADVLRLVQRFMTCRMQAIAPSSVFLYVRNGHTGLLYVSRVITQNA